jgi:hypothetical protein
MSCNNNNVLGNTGTNNGAFLILVLFILLAIIVSVIV